MLLTTCVCLVCVCVAYLDFMSIFQVFTMDFVPWQSLGCATDFDYYTKVLVVTITPICIMAALLVFFFVPMMLYDRCDYSDDDSSRVSHARARRMFWKLVLFTIFLVYPNVSATVLGVFVCKEVDGT